MPPLGEMDLPMDIRVGLMRLAYALAQPAVEDLLVGLAKGTHQVVVKENREAAGWVVRIERIPTLVEEEL